MSTSSEENKVWDILWVEIVNLPIKFQLGIGKFYSFFFRQKFFFCWECIALMNYSRKVQLWNYLRSNHIIAISVKIGYNLSYIFLKYWLSTSNFSFKHVTLVKFATKNKEIKTFFPPKEIKITGLSFYCIFAKKEIIKNLLTDPRIHPLSTAMQRLPFSTWKKIPLIHLNAQFSHPTPLFNYSFRL